jgi:hypothetical protein
MPLPAFWPTGCSWQERFDKIPQRIWKQRGGHCHALLPEVCILHPYPQARFDAKHPR